MIKMLRVHVNLFHDCMLCINLISTIFCFTSYKPYALIKVYMKHKSCSFPCPLTYGISMRLDKGYTETRLHVVVDSLPSSLPRYRTSGDIKGFAFVEFSTQETATKAVEVRT